MARALLIADDLTGAMDGGVQFAQAGIPARIWTDVEAMTPPEGDGVYAVNTETRHLPPEQAAEAVADVCRRAASWGFAYYIKKTDSALRGRIGAELAAMCRTLGREQTVFVPAWPENGRTTRDGVQYLRGVPLHESSVGRDAFDPVLQTNIADILTKDVSLPVCLRRPGQAPAPSGVTVYDGETRRELHQTAQTVLPLAEQAVCAGCAGFCEELTALPGLPVCRSGGNAPPLGRVLLVSGSLHPTSAAQTRSAQVLGYPALPLPATLYAADFTGEQAAALTAQGASLLDREGRLLLAARSRGPADAETAAYTAGHLGALAASLLARADTLVVFGGDTAMGILRALGPCRLDPVCQITPGVVYARLRACGRQINFVSKAGSLGPQDVVARVEAFLKTSV